MLFLRFVVCVIYLMPGRWVAVGPKWDIRWSSKPVEGMIVKEINEGTINVQVYKTAEGQPGTKKKEKRATSCLDAKKRQLSGCSRGRLVRKT